MAHEKQIALPDDFDALLRRTMAEEPSTALLPRIRERIAMEPVPVFSPWRLAFVAAPGVAALAVILWLGLGPASVSVPSTAPVPSVQQVANSRAAKSPGLTTEAGQKPRVLSSGQAAPTRHVVAKVTAEPVVIVDERQRIALLALMRMVGDGRLTEKAFAQTVPPSIEAIREQVVPVAVAPVEVSPIPTGGVLPNEVERN
jgi:hypothetical protein